MGIGQLFWKIALPAVALGLVVTGHAGEPSTVPILRIEAGAHILPISLVDLDRRRNRAITAGYDKTVRIWQLPELRLIRTLRVPIEAGNEGVLFAAAVSPDGRRVAVGGWTGQQWNRSASVYIFDAETGNMIRRIGGFPRLISALGYTADGHHLAVGLQGEGGLRILDATSFAEVASDPEYRGNLTDISAAPGGWLVTTALDGALRVYDGGHHLVQRQPLGISRRPGNTAVSADGQSFALGFSDLPVVAVFRLPDLHLQYVARVADEPGQKGLCCVAWAADGSLVATGEHADGRALVFRWTKEGKAAGPPLDLGRHRAGGKMLLDDGSMLITTDEPRLAIVSRDGQVVRELGSPALDLSQVADGLLLSPDAGRVSWRLPDGYVQAMDLVRQGLFELPPAPGAPVRAVRACTAGREGAGASVCGASRRGMRDAAEQKTYLENREPDVPPPPDILSTQWTAPRREATGRALNCRDAEHPVLDGTPLSLDVQERCTAWSFSADGETLVVGTSWSLRRYGRGGQAIWRVYTQGKVHAVNLSADGRYLVAALADGTLRWYDPNTGQERFGLFLHANELDWVFWRPDGYYSASPEGDQFVGWHVNQGQDKEARFYRAVQFERLFYRPDLIRARLDPNQPAADAGAGASIENIAAIEPPAIRIGEAVGPGGKFAISIDVDGQGSPITEYRVYLNGIPILNQVERLLKASERSRFKRIVAFNATGEGDQLRVEAFNGRSMGLAETYIPTSTKAVPPRRGDLYVLAVGVNHFDRMPQGPKRLLDDLEFAAQDADAFARLMQGTQGHPYEHLYVKVVSDHGNLPTHRAVVEALPFLQRAGADDTVVLFLASHGFSDPAGNYFFVPRDATERDIQDALAGRFVDREPQSLVSWRVLFDAMRDTAGRRLLIVDTCQSLAVAGSFDVRSLKKRTAASRFAMMTASQRNEYSQEYPQGGHGLFTFALLEALKRPDGAAKQRVTVEDAFEQTSRVVKRLGDKDTRQTPQLIAPAFLADKALVAW